jgi:NAD+ synthase
MTLTPKLPGHAQAAIHQFLRSHLAEGDLGAVVGLSGGIDSALVARLAADALGAARVTGVLLPDRTYPPSLVEETRAYARALDIRDTTLAIDPAEQAFRTMFPEVDDRLTWGNTVARIRMTALYTLARERHALVLGTGNKSELLLGYFTKHGDGGVDLLPIGDLYKTQVYELARELHVPTAIRERAPSAGLWEGQTDEDDLGLPYAQIDQILFGIEELRSESEIAERSGIPLSVVRGIADRVATNRHKRLPPPIPKLGLRTIGLDWRD